MIDLFLLSWALSAFGTFTLLTLAYNVRPSVAALEALALGFLCAALSEFAASFLML